MADDAARGGTGASRVGGRPKPSTTSSTSKIGGKDAPYALGARVTANYQGAGSWYPGTIVKVQKNGTYDIHYDDNDKEKSVPRDYIKITVLDVDINDTYGDDNGGIINDEGEDDYGEGEYTLEDMMNDRARLDAGMGGGGAKVKQPQRPTAPPRNRPQSAALRR